MQPAPDWFDRLWDENAHNLPVWLRNPSGKKLVRNFAGILIETAGVMAQTPEGVRQVVAYARILAAVRGVRGVFDSPDPSPEQVAAFVERLVQKVKP
jgi:hypothetical protein